MLEKLTPAAFEQLMGSRFRVDLGDAPSQELELVEVQRYKPEWQGPRVEPFSVFFLSSSTWILQQQIYRLEHESLGTLELFLVPVAREGQRIRYEAVFN
jgi:hypothetical protein